MDGDLAQTLTGGVSALLTAGLVIGLAGVALSVVRMSRGGMSALGIVLSVLGLCFLLLSLL